MINAIKEQSSTGVKEFLESVVLTELKEIQVMGSDANVAPATRLAAKQYLVNRFLGNPNQPITTNEKPASELSSDELAAKAAVIVEKYGELAKPSGT